MNGVMGNRSSKSSLMEWSVGIKVSDDLVNSQGSFVELSVGLVDRQSIFIDSPLV